MYFTFNKILLLVLTLSFITSCSNHNFNNPMDWMGRGSRGADGDVLIDYYTRSSVNTSEVTIRVLGKTSAMDIAHTFAVGYGTTFPILGLYPNYLNTVEITDNGQTITRYIQTDALSGISDATIVTDNLQTTADPFNQDLYWVMLNNTWETVAYDRKGHVRYYYPSLLSQGARIFEDNGEIKIQTDYSIVSLGGSVSFKANSSYEYHHDKVQLSSGNYVLLSETTWGSEDRVIEQTSSGVVVRDLTFGSLFRDIVDVDTNPDRTDDLAILNKIIYDDSNIRKDNGANASTDWAHCNSLVYDSTTGIMYFSLRHQAVIAVDYSNWKLLWWLVDDSLSTTVAVPSGYNANNLKDIKSLEDYRVGGNGINDGPRNQHALFLHSNGNLGMFDNGGDDGNRPSRYVEYSITGSTGSYSASKTREYKDSSLFSQIMSDVDFTGDDNLLIGWSWLGSGSYSRIREVDSSDTVLFDMQTSVFYRMDKMPIYPYQDSNKKYAMDYNEKEGK